MSQKTERSAKRAPNVFINYRREDTAGHAGRLFDRLSDRLPGRVFMDVDTIEPGVDFAEVIEQAVGKCEVLIVMIGREWLKVTDATGARRLDNPNDFVRLEVASALDRNIRVIPVLVEDATMPRPEDLPPDLAKLARRNAIELSDARWAFDVDRLIQTIQGVLQEKAPPAPVTPVPPPPEPNHPARARAWTRIAWITPSVLLLLVLAGWIGGRLLEPRTPQKPVEVASLESAAIPAVEPPATEKPPESTVASSKPPEPEEPVSAGNPAETEVPAQPQPDLPYGPDTCKQGFAWREAGPEDRVCVMRDVQDQTRQDNLQAEARRNPGGGDFGPDTCRPGYVWREAFEGDRVCVTLETRDQARLDNEKANERRMRPMVRWAKARFKKPKPGS